MSADPATQHSVVLDLGGGSQFLVVTGTEGQHLHLTIGGRYLCAERPGDAVVCNRELASNWESFLLIQPKDLLHLRFLLVNRWLVRSSGHLSNAEMTGQGFGLRLGEIEIDLRGNTPLRTRIGVPDAIAADVPFLSTWIVRDGWRIEELLLYRPLIYYAAFGPDAYFDQMRLSLESLFQIGRYDGTVLVITDRDAAGVARFTQTDWQQTIVVQRQISNDPMTISAARYSIIDVPDAAGFQPILYVDTDVLFDAEALPLLIAIMSSDRITAVRETHHDVAAVMSLGGGLLAADGCVVGDARGFNSGQLGIPHIAKAEEAFRLIMDSVENLRRQDSSMVGVWLDQPVANYIAFKLGGFDLDTLSQFGGVAWQDGKLQAPPRRGLLHFWPAGSTAAEKCQAMENYLAMLTGVDGEAAG